MRTGRAPKKHNYFETGHVRRRDAVLFDERVHHWRTCTSRSPFSRPASGARVGQLVACGERNHFNVDTVDRRRITNRAADVIRARVIVVTSITIATVLVAIASS